MYQNYIFDLYGTLLQIHTDEEPLSFWDKVSDIFAVYGADYTGIELRDAYHRLCHEEEEKLKDTYAYPEIDLAVVFQRLLKEAPLKHPTEVKVPVKQAVHHIANTFRALSRDVCWPYEHTIDVLKELKHRGCRIFLLSNAQHIFTMPELEMRGLKEYFDAIYISSDYGMKKPQKEFMELLLKQESLNPAECVMTGDSFDADIAVAMANGIDSVFLNTPGYAQAEAERRFSAVRLNENYNPHMIMSGDIAELLNL